MSAPGRGSGTPVTGGSIRIFAPLAEDYATARPGYPSAVFDALLERMTGGRAPSPPIVIDVAAGSGAATRGLLGRGVRVLAVEPALEMLRLAVERAVGSGDWLGGVVARAEGLPVADRIASAIVVAQAFHWLDPGPALDEFARVLAPGAVLLLLWNVTEADPFTSDVWELVDGFNPGARRPVTQEMRAPPAALKSDSRFRIEPFIEVAHERELSVADYARYARSWSYVGGALDPGALADLAMRLEEVALAHFGSGPVRERFVAVAHFARRV